MTPKEKAKELVARYDVLQTFIENFHHDHAIECAIIAVDEVLQLFEYTNGSDYRLEYYEEVKEELTKQQEQ